MLNVTFTDLKDRALVNLQNNWGRPLLAFLIIAAVSVACQFVPFVGGLAVIILGGPLALGAAMYSLNFARGKDPDPGSVFDGFKNFGNSLAAYLLMIIIVWLFLLLLIVPGIIRAIAYSQVFFIMAKEPNIEPMEALKKSRAMMDGHKWDFFVLGLSFIGWHLLALLTFGIGYLWLTPYIRITQAHFHQEITGDFYNEGDVYPDEAIMV